ncbi:PREDICTED: uncharacterized protein LOC109221832 [Nicotiana attenuata]|uniref:uncharacterized protein LOC109221832 n=1 Tax=Nicotiana attenuata TaxID=49451 RepID=UPI000905206B|nr:PREDICTED: uncharacterized protein LOC109221832 [Nicotiana attenuata]
MKISYFRFLNFWTKQPSFQDLVKEVWDTPIQGNPMWTLHQKMKILSNKLSKWSRENIETSRENLNKVQAEYIKWQAMQESLLKQKAQIQWFEDGDCNTRYFHNVIRERRRKCQIHIIKNHRGKWMRSEQSIKKAAINHYEKLFNLPKKDHNMDIIDCIPKIVTEEDNDYLTRMPTEEEIREAIFNISTDSAAGPDGFNGAFYQSCWHIIKVDITRFVRAFLNGAQITKYFSHTCLVLIPKTDASETFSDLRPISLSNDRLIMENVLLAQEIIQRINSYNKGGNIIIKLDMEKAYDRMSWEFINAVMRKFGFSEKWINMTQRILSMFGIPSY